jgi:hypothetical protein
MANKRITELPTAGALDGSELVEVVQGGANTKTTAQDIADLGGGSSNLEIGVSPITGGVSTTVLFNNGGQLGEYTISGSDNVAMTNSPALTGTPTAPTQTPLTTNTTIATTAYADAAVAAASLTQATVTEVKNYYYGEFRVNRLINTSTGATTASNDYDVTDFIEIEPSTSIKIYTHDGTDIRLYGWTYDANFTAISEFRSNTLLTTLIDTYTFTTPSNAKYIQLYTRYTTGGPWSIVNRGWAAVLRIESTSTHTYASPILPEQFAGSTDAEKIQAAFDFQRWTTSAVQTNGNYLIDTTLFIYSNTNWINSGRLKMADGLHDNLFRNEAVKYPTNIRIRGNRNITISGNGVFEGGDEEWGGLPAPGVGNDWWLSIMCLLANVEIFSINNVQTKDPAAWAWSLESCRFGTIDGLYFNHDLSENNQDGLNFRFGNHDIGAINLRGTTGDDLFAITLLPDFPLAHILGVTTVYDPAETTNNTHDISIRDSFGIPSRLFSDEDTPVFSTGGLLLVEDGAKIYNISIDNVSGLGQIRIGVNDSPYWAVTPATVNDMYNISITNTSVPIQIRQPMKNSTFFNVSRLDRFNITGSAAIPEGSLNMTRKYKDRNIEFFPTIPSFDPLDTPDLEIWYDVNDAATITKSSNLVSQMTDKSGNGHTVSEATNKPLWVDKKLGNKPVIQFDGINDALRSALIPELQGITAFTAFLVGNNGTPIVWHGEDFANRTEIIGGSTPSIVVSNGGNASGAMTATGILSGTGMRIDGIYNGGASGNANRAKLMLTSDPKTLTFTGTIPATTENNASSTFAIGVIDNASPIYFQGEFAEFLFYTRVLTDGEISDIQDYLSHKWGL